MRAADLDSFCNFSCKGGVAAGMSCHLMLVDVDILDGTSRMKAQEIAVFRWSVLDI